MAKIYVGNSFKSVHLIVYTKKPKVCDGDLETSKHSQRSHSRHRADCTARWAFILFIIYTILYL